LAPLGRLLHPRPHVLEGLALERGESAPPTAEQQTLFGALRTNDEDTDRFFDVVAGTVRPDEFLAPENIGRIVGAPLRA
jgi:hypothetical protein